MSDKRQGLFQGGSHKDGGGYRDSRGKKDKQNKPEKPEPVKIEFSDKNGRLRRELLAEDAEKWAHDIADGGVSYTQLRKFYSDALALKSKMEEKDFVEVEALVGMMIAKANYSMVRDSKNTKLFHFINSCIRSIHSEKDFNAFVLFFEAVLGFYPRKN
jgi:CRISPR type III-A-associated protein Csm2